MNAIEHGNQGRAEMPVEVEVVATGGELVVRIRDVGDGPAGDEVESPDIEAKLAGLQKPRGWGLFLIENMVDEIRVIDDGRPTHGRARPATGRRWRGWRRLSSRRASATGGDRPVIELAGDVDGRRRGGA